MTNKDTLKERFVALFKEWAETPIRPEDETKTYTQNIMEWLDNNLPTLIEQTKKEERQRINTEWLELNLRNDNKENWEKELSRFGFFMQSIINHKKQ